MLPLDGEGRRRSPHRLTDRPGGLAPATRREWPSGEGSVRAQGRLADPTPAGSTRAARAEPLVASRGAIPGLHKKTPVADANPAGCRSPTLRGTRPPLPPLISPRSQPGTSTAAGHAEDSRPRRGQPATPRTVGHAVESRPLRCGRHAARILVADCWMRGRLASLRRAYGQRVPAWPSVPGAVWPTEDCPPGRQSVRR